MGILFSSDNFARLCRRNAVASTSALLMLTGGAGCSKPAASDPAANSAPASSTGASTTATVDHAADEAFALDNLSRAFQAAFPHGAVADVTADGTTSSEYDNGYSLTFAPKQLVPVADGLVALVSEGTDKEACHACDGKLAVSFLRYADSTFAPTAPPKTIVLGGNGYGIPPTWRVTTDEGYPALRLETGYSDHGCTGSAVTVYELRPEGVAKDKTISKESAETCS